MKKLMNRVKNFLREPLRIKGWSILILLPVLCIGFMANSCDSQTTASNSAANEACQMWGCGANVTNYYEYHQRQQIYQELDNPDLLLNDYLYSPMTGQLTCFGKSYGYGVPYSTEMSPPVGAGSQGSVPEPNALYPSQNTNADWLNRDHDTKKSDTIKPDFVEPELIVTPQNLPCTPLQGSGHD